MSVNGSDDEGDARRMMEESDVMRMTEEWDEGNGPDDQQISVANNQLDMLCTTMAAMNVCLAEVRKTVSEMQYNQAVLVETVKCLQECLPPRVTAGMNEVEGHLLECPVSKSTPTNPDYHEVVVVACSATVRTPACTTASLVSKAEGVLRPRRSERLSHKPQINYKTQVRGLY